MATTYSSAQVAPTYPTKLVQSGVARYYGTFTWANAFVIDDIVKLIQLPPIPAGLLRVVGYYFETTRIDSNGAPALTVDIGYGGAAASTTNNLLLSANATIGRAAGLTQLNNLFNTGGYGMLVPAAGTTIDVHILAAPATGVTSGTMKIGVDVAFDII